MIRNRLNRDGKTDATIHGMIWQSIGTGCQERLWCLFPWRCSRLMWTLSCANYCREPALAGLWTWSPEVPSIPLILSFCDMTSGKWPWTLSLLELKKHLDNTLDFWARSWTWWSLGDPSNMRYSMVLWFNNTEDKAL